MLKCLHNNLPTCQFCISHNFACRCGALTTSISSNRRREAVKKHVGKVRYWIVFPNYLTFRCVDEEIRISVFKQTKSYSELRQFVVRSLLCICISSKLCSTFIFLPGKFWFYVTIYVLVGVWPWPPPFRPTGEGKQLKSTWVRRDIKMCFPIIWHLDVFICWWRDPNSYVQADQELFRTEAVCHWELALCLYFIQALVYLYLLDW